ncbi:MAG: ycfH 1, partial [Verrucomicrobiales bacterium]|nr:ycfH 1 [Verrucomicrobiales bacterium]
MTLRDAHTHLHFPSLTKVGEEAWAAARNAGVVAAVVNGTCEEDWGTVRDWVVAHPGCRAAFGIHPWQAAGRSADWKAGLRRFLENDPSATVGEIGLDHWVKDHDATDQKVLFLEQWELARELGRAATVHCVRAFEPLRQCLQHLPPAVPGFLLHAYSGPVELIPFFVEKGAYFSYSPYFLAERKRPQREAFKSMPRERILLETDSPELAPPSELNPWPLTDPATGSALNHPANLLTACESLAEVFGCPAAEVAELTTANWLRLFESSSVGVGSGSGSGSG